MHPNLERAVIAVSAFEAGNRVIRKKGRSVFAAGMMRARGLGCSDEAVMWSVSRPAAATAGLLLLSILLSEIEIWVSDDVPGPQAGRALPLLLLLSVPILWRRRFPLAVCLAILAGLDGFSVWRGSPEGAELFVPLAVASFSVGAFCSRRRAMLGLCVLALGYAVYALEDIHVVQGGGTGEWAGGFFGVVILAFWLLGVFLHSRRESAELAGRAGARGRARRCDRGQ